MMPRPNLAPRLRGLADRRGPLETQSLTSWAFLPEGTIVGDYRIERPATARRGADSLYDATALSTKEPVHLRVLGGPVGRDPSFRARFLAELPMQLAFRHPAVVPVHGGGETRHDLFIATRPVHGRSLAELIAAQRLSPARVLAILEPVGAALDAAHAAGLLHRGIEPHAIVVERKDHALLTDFGLSALEELGPRAATGLDYVAPEQLAGDPATVASDIHGLAAVAWEALSGLPPTRPGESEDEPASISGWPLWLAPEAGVALERGLSADPEARPGTARELLDALRAGLGAAAMADVGARVRDHAPPRIAPVGDVPAGTGAAPARPHAPRARLVALTAAVVAAGALGGYLLGAHGSGASPAATATPASRLDAGDLSLEAPRSWHAIAAGAPATDLGLRDASALEPTAGATGTLIAGQAPNADPAGLPAPILSRLARAASPGEPVRLGELAALRYTRVALGRGSANVYIVPNSAGVATVACLARTEAALAAFQPRCERVAATLELRDGTRALAPTPSPAYAATLTRVVGGLNRARSTGLDHLRSAGTPAGQAGAARELSGAYSRAAGELAKLPADAGVGANAAVLAALRGASGAYAALAGAANGSDGAGYERARLTAGRAESAVRAQLVALAARGFAPA